MSKKDEILGKSDVETYELNQEEKNQLNALVELMSQAQQASDIIYTNLVNSVSARYEISNAQVDLNMDEVLGGTEPHLRVTRD